jgi:hypothetical protein
MRHRLIHFVQPSLAFAAMAILVAGCQQEIPRGAVASFDQALELRETLAKSSSGSAPKREAVVQTRTGWATLRGTVKVVGGVPERVPLLVNKDTDVCAPGGERVLSQAVLVNPTTGALQNVAFYAGEVSPENVHDSSKPGKTDEVVFDQLKCVFLTHVQLMQATQQLKILNSDTIPHNTKIDASRARKFNENIPSKANTTYMPGRAEKEPVPVSCSIHPWMSAYLLPLDNSYGAVTDADGNFEIANLPAGVTLTIQAWQEKLGKNFKDITVNGEKTTWKRGRIELTLDPDETRSLNIEIPVAAFQ